jgi:muramidase (phage lysozyme)
VKDYTELVKNPNIQIFLSLIRHTEGAAYDTLFGGGKFSEFDDHPRQAITRNLGGKPITSTAAGAYQFLSRTWDECRQALSLPDFTPPSQDMAAVFLIDRRGALSSVMLGDWQGAILKCNREWASLPGSPYGQPTYNMTKCLAFIAQQTGGDAVASAPFQQPTEKGNNMAPFILAALPSLLQAAPALIRIFGKGEQAEKNAKSAEIVAEIAKTVTGSDTVEGAVNSIQADPAVAEEFAGAVEARWYELTGEAGGGGIDGARKANAAMTKPANNPAIWVSMAILPLVYIVVGAVMFGEGWAPDVRAMVVSSIISLVLGAITGYFLGTSFSSQRKTELMGRQ